MVTELPYAPWQTIFCPGGILINVAENYPQNIYRLKHKKIPELVQKIILRYFPIAVYVVL